MGCGLWAVGWEDGPKPLSQRFGRRPVKRADSPSLAAALVHGLWYFRTGRKRHMVVDTMGPLLGLGYNALLP